MNPRVSKVVAQDNYTLLVYFTNGEKGMYDMKPLLAFPIFQTLKELNVFATVRVGNGNTVCWGEDIDICPDTIYLDSMKL